MLRSHTRLAAMAVTLGDMAAVLVAYLVAQRLGHGISPVAVLLLAVLHQVALSAGGLHTSLRSISVWDLATRVVGAWLRILIGVAVLHWLDPIRVSREAGFGFALAFLPALAAVRFGTMAVRHFVRSRGRNIRYVVIAGVGPTAKDIAEAIAEHPGWGLRLLGHLSPAEPHPETRVTSNVLGGYLDLPELVKHHVIDELVIADHRSSMRDVVTMVALAQTIGVRVHVVANFIPGSWRAVEARDWMGHLLLSLTPFPHDMFGLTLKRALDFVTASIGVLVLLPVMIGIALAIRFTSTGPVFFSQPRAGVNGRLFRFYKFRTMVVGAEAKRHELLVHNEMSGPVFKMRDDPRITPIGRFLRRYSLDELPQLWNVVKGDMSLVGPRPLMPHEVAGYEPWHRRRMSMRPGLTCLWQISGRNNVDFDDWMKMDLSYIDNWSFRMDLKILARTVPAVFFGRGAS